MMWSRPSYAARFCAVVTVDASVHTRCNGRWDARDDRETMIDPPVSERCGACARAVAAIEAAVISPRVNSGLGSLPPLMTSEEAIEVRGWLDERSHPLDRWCPFEEPVPREHDGYEEMEVTPCEE